MVVEPAVVVVMMMEASTMMVTSSSTVMMMTSAVWHGYRPSQLKHSSQYLLVSAVYIASGTTAYIIFIMPMHTSDNTLSHDSLVVQYVWGAVCIKIQFCWCPNFRLDI